MTPAARLALAGPSTILFAIGLALTACSKTDKAPVPAHSDVAASMPDAASTPGAQGPATASPGSATGPAPTTPADTVPPPTAPATAPPK